MSHQSWNYDVLRIYRLVYCNNGPHYILFLLHDMLHEREQRAAIVPRGLSLVTPGLLA